MPLGNRTYCPEKRYPLPRRARPADPVPTDRTPLNLTWDQVGRFAEAVTFAQRELLSPAKDMTEKFALGPRGIWLIALVASGRVKTPGEFARIHRIGKSLVSDQIALLTENGILAVEQSETDLRQKNLSLTEYGYEINRQLGDAFTAKLRDRLKHYTEAEIEFTIRMLYDLAGDYSLFK
jgi:DNA-binding MarR family transcriptional regulator